MLPAVTSNLSYRQAQADDITRAMTALVAPARGYIGCNEILATLCDVPDACITELRSLPLGSVGQKLVALRYFIANGATWLKYFNWENSLTRARASAPNDVRSLLARVERVRGRAPVDMRGVPGRDGHPAQALTGALTDLAAQLEEDAGQSDAALALHVALAEHAELRTQLIARLRDEAVALHAKSPRATDVLYLSTYDLTRLPATTVGEGALAYVIVADKGEMGVRAVRETLALGAKPVVLYSERDDDGALQVRLAEANGGFGIPLEGTFRESYGNATQIAEKVHAAYEARFAARAKEELSKSALYPGYGPLAENASAIELFRRSGIVFVGPMQDVVERAGDKRKFRQLAQAIDAKAVPPGIVIQAQTAPEILAAIRAGYEEMRFGFPGRLKAANGGGGRGQAVVPTPEGLEAAVQKVLGEIAANGWDHGVMFEENIPETIHLEVQLVRDRYGNTRHFGMRDCTEQRASQKIQEEAPPALMRAFPGLEPRICEVAVRIVDAVGYVGAATVELMFKDGHFYLLEMNTRIQVEHPVSEEAHRIGPERAPLDLVALQLKVARGEPIAFAQSDVVCTHVAREFRINAESWKADIKDSRDGKLGLFLPNAGVFDVIELPDVEQVKQKLAARGVRGIAELKVRFDTGFEAGDKLLNKDPTFGKLIVAVAAGEGHEEARFELLRQASLEVLRGMRIEGRALSPTGSVIKGTPFLCNLADHVRVLESETVKAHMNGVAPGRHVNWVVAMLRGA
jgi:acetyl/propionyl-CoA carboxylase alpha subunit